MADWKVYRLKAYSPADKSWYNLALKANSPEGAKELASSLRDAEGNKRFTRIESRQ